MSPAQLMALKLQNKASCHGCRFLYAFGIDGRSKTTIPRALACVKNMRAPERLSGIELQRSAFILGLDNDNSRCLEYQGNKYAGLYFNMGELPTKYLERMSQFNREEQDEIIRFVGSTRAAAK